MAPLPILLASSKVLAGVNFSVLAARRPPPLAPVWGPMMVTGLLAGPLPAEDGPAAMVEG